MKNQLILSITCFILIICTAHALPQPTEEDVQLKTDIFEPCLTTSENKYELYINCIGKFTRICLQHPEFYAAEMAFPSSDENCALRESNIWGQLFEELSEKFIKNADKRFVDIKVGQQELKNEKDAGYFLPPLTVKEKQKLINEHTIMDKALRKELNNTLISLINGPSASCVPTVVIWQKDRRLETPEVLECLRNSAGEASITVYLWNKELEAHLTKEN